MDACEENLLRRMLDWPILWRWAANYILENVTDHVESAECLICLVKLRKLKFQHTPTIDARRQTFCSKCGILLSEWRRNPKCAGRSIKQTSPPPPPPFVVIPLNWN